MERARNLFSTSRKTGDSAALFFSQIPGAMAARKNAPLAVLTFLIVASGASAQTETILYNFAGGTDGGSPGGLVIGSAPDGRPVFYGTTFYGGGAGSCSSGCGTVFSLTPPASPGGSWTKAVLYSFAGNDDGASNDGANPLGVVVDGSSGHPVLYGTTQSGGTGASGTVFSLTPPGSPGAAWTETVSYSFTGGSDGRAPNGVVVGSGANGVQVLYGTTVLGGTSDSLGVVFSLTPSGLGATWTEEVLHAFTGKQDGEYPVGNIAAGPDGALYVATSGIYGE